MATIRVPFRVDGTPLVVTPPAGFRRVSDNPAGFTHNGSEADVQQTDADEAVFGGVSFYGDSFTWDVKTKAQMDAHYTTSNGALGLWIKKIGDNIYRMTQYDVTRGFTPAEVTQNERYFGGTSAALRDGGGEFITDAGGFVIFTT